MANIVEINISDQTKPLTEVGMNKILVLTKSADIEYKEVNDTSGVTELKTTDTGYKLLELILAQAKQDVAIFGATTLTDSTVKEELNKLAGKDFFFIVSDLSDDAEITAIGEWATSNDRIALVTPEVSGTATTIKALASTINSDNVGIYAHAGSPKGTTTVFLNAGITGLMSVKPTGSATWALKSPNLIPNIYFPLADENELIKANVNVWADELGRGLTKGGRTTSGSYLDITQGKYWLKNKLRAELTLLLINRDKVPFTNVGRTLIMEAIERVVTAGDRQGIIIKDETTIVVPKAEELLTNDRANRKWTNIVITSRIQGSVESLEVQYVLTV